ncbi:MAG: hypothetical protein BGN85_08465 [Alphaproteobacteria bacterium 64-11]|nr:DUF4908 domain-containing protein [Alphaproteobacteria bacterium]OJU10645.1 MAG: hypothetical protein BGN85_08465 [Alphaproteobacteria bacterium 64-11]
MTYVRTIAAAFLFAAIPAAWAQPEAPPGINPYTNPMAARLSAERMGDVRPGIYSTGDGSTVFTLKPYNGKYLLTFQNSPEVFVLSVEHGSLGARILKYDTGATAIRVSVWGGMTLYTRDAPGGVPATRQDDAPPATDLAISQPELQAALEDEAGHLTYVQKVDLRFSADPAVMSGDPDTRGRAFDALINAALGIERYLTSLPIARQIFSKRINSVKVAEGGKPTVTLTGQTLLVSFVPGEGHEGHASSLAIEQELSRLLANSAKDVAAK